MVDSWPYGMDYVTILYGKSGMNTYKSNFARLHILNLA